MAKVIFGNHSSVIVPQPDRDSIRKFYCDVLGGVITKEENERDFLRLGDNFYIGFLYGDVPDESEFLRTARSVWLEIKSDDVEEMSRKIVESGLVRSETTSISGSSTGMSLMRASSCGLPDRSGSKSSPTTWRK